MIGVFGGTFDPIHYGHLRPALEVQQALGMRQIRFIPSFIPPHRAKPGASAQQRLAMLQLAIADQSGFVVDTIELDRGGPSYMVDTLTALRDELGDEPIALILGQDAFARLDSWHHWRRVNELAHVVVVSRPGGTLPQSGPLAELLAQRRCHELALLHEHSAAKLWVQEVTSLDISATKIRALAKQSGFRFLTPEPVREYIEAQGLYR